MDSDSEADVTDVGTAIGVKVAIALVRRPAMKALARFYTRVVGRNILVLGPASAGKTSFVDYLQFGVLEPLQPTARTLEVRHSASFRVQVGREGALELKVSKSTDVPGQLGPTEHAKIASRRRPHAIIVMLDASAPSGGKTAAASGPWLSEFCSQLDDELRSVEGFASRLKVVIFVANKVDRISAEAATKKVEAFRKIIGRCLKQSLGVQAKSMSVMPCILVEHANALALADAVVVHLAKALQK